ncbi:hypothetical protein [Massilia sp. DWR3-1-1]|uniref:hypothetical protein n=1 Tax=Massilia sp. DWR3-1-1 TaxID=2804559 RepID=UPI003CF728D5
MTTIDPQTKKLAAIAYGEASAANDPDEIAGIAFAVANRARAWNGKSLDELLSADPNYTYAVKDGNARYELLMATGSEESINKNNGMRIALESARRALKNEGPDPSNGAYWWDGVDFKTNYNRHPKVKDGFHFGSPEHNIFNVAEKNVDITIYWKVRDKKTGKEINSKIRGKYNCVWKSTSAHGKTIFWIHDTDYLTATGGKAYK